MRHELRPALPPLSPLDSSHYCEHNGIRRGRRCPGSASSSTRSKRDISRCWTGSASSPRKALDKCVVRIERLRDEGYDLRRPEADYLRDGIYELRARHQNVNYRILYFFHTATGAAAILAHGLTKEDKVAARDIDLAIARKAKFESDPEAHTPEEDEEEQDGEENG